MSPKGATALHYAIQQGSVSVAEVLLAARADTNLLVKGDLTPLCLAVMQGRVDLARLLIDAGASIDVMVPVRFLDLLEIEARMDPEKLIKIVQDPATLEEKSLLIEGFSLLHVAAEQGNLEMLNLLMGEGISSSGVTQHGYTPMHVAAQKGHETIVKALLDADADPCLRNDLGETPQEVAHRKGKEAVADMLGEAGVCDPVFRDEL